MDAVIEYLLKGDPAIRWQVMADLTDADPEAITAERARVAREGWGARLLAEQSDDGLWDGGVYRPGWADESRPMYDAWTATHFSLQQLVDFGVDPADPAVRRAIGRVRENVRWDHAGEPYFDGETEPCINGVALAVAAYFGEDGAPIARTLLHTQLPDGGWNCWDDDGTSPSSFHSTICALEGLLAWERRAGAAGAAVAEARRRGEEYLLDRRLLWRASDGAVIDPRFAMLSYPTRWFYDVLRGLDHMRRARPERDPRCADAIEVLRSRRRPDGMFTLENTHEGPTLFSFENEGEGFPSRWVTLRALRVLRWWDAAA
ncbi:hypothetical protein [Microbacterium sp.]|uniref:hypothetical protein n=1 Tax=Microbacterium sp. TaxID=51671 RepID=UPI003A8DFED6